MLKVIDLMNQRKAVYIALLLNVILFADINASSSSTTTQIKDNRPIPPTIEYIPSLYVSKIRDNTSHSQLSQIYVNVEGCPDSEDEFE